MTVVKPDGLCGSPLQPWQDPESARRTHRHTGWGFGLGLRGGGRFLNVKGYLWMKDGAREWGGWHGIHAAEAEVGISLWDGSCLIQRNHIQIFGFCEVFSVVKIFATAQPQLMGKTKTARARSMARWSCVRRTPPYTYCLCDEIKKEKKLSKMSRVITKEIQFTATQGCQ